MSDIKQPNLGIKLPLYDTVKQPPTTIGYYIGVIQVSGELRDVYKVYWNGKNFVQEQWQGIKVVKYFKVEDLIAKSK